MSMSDALTELRRSTAPVICASCCLGYTKFDGDTVCPNTAKIVLEFARRSFEQMANGQLDSETVELEVFGDTVDEREVVTSTVKQVRAGLARGAENLSEEAIQCALTVGSRVIDGVNGLVPTKTYSRVDITRLSSPVE